MDNPYVKYQVTEGVAFVTLDNPERRNTLCRLTLAGLRESLSRAAADAAARVVILRANGPAFSAGHDLRELVEAGQEESASLFALCTEVMEAIRKLPKPVIAQVQGIATAAGCQLAASCDLVVASEAATFATPGVKIGLFCSTPAVALSRAVLPKHALEMLLTGDPVAAAEAQWMGLVNRVTKPEKLAEETLKLARQLCGTSAKTLALGKAAFYAQLPHDYPAAYEAAQRAMVANAMLPDAQEGMRAFLEKRPPKWQ